MAFYRAELITRSLFSKGKVEVDFSVDYRKLSAERRSLLDQGLRLWLSKELNNLLVKEIVNFKAC